MISDLVSLVDENSSISNNAPKYETQVETLLNTSVESMKASRTVTYNEKVQSTQVASLTEEPE